MEIMKQKLEISTKLIIGVGIIGSICFYYLLGRFIYKLYFI